MIFSIKFRAIQARSRRQTDSQNVYFKYRLRKDNFGPRNIYSSDYCSEVAVDFSQRKPRGRVLLNAIIHFRMTGFLCFLRSTLILSTAAFSLRLSIFFASLQSEISSFSSQQRSVLLCATLINKHDNTVFINFLAYIGLYTSGSRGGGAPGARPPKIPGP